MPTPKHITDQLAAAEAAVAAAVANVEPHPFGHAFLWGYVEVTLKNGNKRVYRRCLASVCAADLRAACKLAETVPGVSNVTYNLD